MASKTMANLMVKILFLVIARSFLDYCFEQIAAGGNQAYLVEKVDNEEPEIYLYDGPKR